MYNINNQPEVFLATNFVIQAGIVHEVQFYKFLSIIGLSKDRAEKVLRLMIRNNFVVQIDVFNDIAINKSIKHRDLNENLERSIWIYLDLIENKFRENAKNVLPNFYCNYPISATLITSLSPLNSISLVCVKEGEEAFISNYMNTSFAVVEDTIDLGIVVSNTKQIEKINLPDRFNIEFFAIVSPDGTTNYYQLG